MWKQLKCTTLERTSRAHYARKKYCSVWRIIKFYLKHLFCEWRQGAGSAAFTSGTGSSDRGRFLESSDLWVCFRSNSSKPPCQFCVANLEQHHVPCSDFIVVKKTKILIHYFWILLDSSIYPCFQNQNLHPGAFSDLHTKSRPPGADPVGLQHQNHR